MRDLGMSQGAIAAYHDRFSLRGPPATGDAPDERGPAEPGSDAPLGGADWYWGVRARKSDFW